MEEKKPQGKKNTQRKAGQPGKTQMSQKTQGSKNVKRSSGLCSLSSKCGGCQWINKPYAEQLSAKETRVRKLMEPFCKPEKIIGMEQPTHYRNKVHAVFVRIVFTILSPASTRRRAIESSPWTVA